jgi:uncharacterized protein YbjT (DUF2867 family)
MRLTIFGANGPTGRLLTRQALDEGHEVVAFTRRPDSFPDLADHPGGLDVVGGDVLDPVAVERAVKGGDAVVSTLGVPFGRRPVRTYSEGVANVVTAMRAHDLTRLVGVTSTAVEPHRQPGGFVFNRVVQPLVGVVGRTVYEDMRRMEALVRETGLGWTIVRPSGLFHREGVGGYVMAAGFLPGRFTSRADLADALLRLAVDGGHEREVVSVVSGPPHPSMVKLIWREAVGKRA